MDELSKELAKQAAGVLNEGYKYLVSPSAKPIGQMVSFIPRTLKVALGKWEKWIMNAEESLIITSELVGQKLKDVPEDQITDTEPYIVIPAIQQLSYCQDNEVLRNLYANLIASSMVIDKKPLVHPAFVDIIKQLTPDEAKIMSKLSYKLNQRYTMLRICKEKEKGYYETVFQYFSDIAVEILDYPQEYPTYINNLERLKIIAVDDPRGGSVGELEKAIFENCKPFLPPLEKEYSYVPVFPVYFSITSFGSNFIKTCCQ